MPHRRSSAVRARSAAALGVLAVVGLAGCDPAGDDDAPPDEPRFEADPDCFGIAPVALASDEVDCGTVRVPLHHDDPDAGSADLAVAVFGSSEAGADEAPVLLLGGGPGQHMVEPHLTQPQLREILDSGRETIVVDQRGVGVSDPALGCPELAESDDAEQALEASLDALGACHARLVGEGVDLDAFHHRANARDVDAVRAALGHERLNLRGVSYGTQVALLAAEMFPDRVRSVILSSPLDPTDNWVDGIAVGYERALARVAQACEADAECRAEVDVAAAIEETTGRLAGEPARVTVQSPSGGEVTRTYTADKFMTDLFWFFYDSTLATHLPAFVERAREGELEPLATVAAALEEQTEGSSSRGMQFAMICSGEGGLADPDVADLESQVLVQHWFDSDLLGGQMGTACQEWDVAQAYDPDEVTLGVDVPTLLVTGELDHVTPPRLGEQVHAALPSSHLVEVPGGAHGPLEVLSVTDSCGREIVVEFLDDPDRRPDDGCVTATELGVTPELPRGIG